MCTSQNKEKTKPTRKRGKNVHAYSLSTKINQVGICSFLMERFSIEPPTIFWISPAYIHLCAWQCPFARIPELNKIISYLLKGLRLTAVMKFPFACLILWGSRYCKATSQCDTGIFLAVRDGTATYLEIILLNR